MQDSHGIRYLKDLQLGIDELQWLQREGEERATALALALMARPGLVTGITARGGLDRVWRAADEDDDGTLTVEVDAHWQESDPNTPGRAILVDREGFMLLLDQAFDLEVPDDNTWRTLVVHKETTYYERGTVAFTTGSTTVTGTGTEFTRYAGYTDDGFNRGSKIGVLAADTSNGNSGSMEIDEIVSDTELRLREPPSGTTESGVRFRIDGSFWSTAPSDAAIHQRRDPKIELITRCRDPIDVDANYTDYVVICDVKRDSGSTPECTFIDRRGRNLFQPLRKGGMWPVLQSQATGLVGASYSSTPIVPISGFSVGAAITGMDLCATDDGGMLVVYSTGGNVIVRRWEQDQRSWVNPNTGATGSGVTIGSGAKPTVIQLPLETGYSHLAAYIRSGIVYAKRSTDHGSTWGSEVTLWDPTTIDASDAIEGLHAILLANHRVLVGGIYFDNSSSTQKYTARYITSDDYGDNYDSNTDAGYTASNPSLGTAAIIHPRLMQDEVGRVWFSYSRATTGQYLYMHPSDDDSGTEWDTASLTAPWYIVQPNNAGSTQAYEPACFFSAQGMAACWYVASDGSAQDYLRLITVGVDDTVQAGLTDRHIAGQQVGLLQDNTTGTPGSRYWPVVHPRRDGSLAMGYVDNEGQRICVLSFYPARLERRLNSVQPTE